MRNYTDQDWEKCEFIVNEVNTFLNEIADKVREIFIPYLNRQVLTKTLRPLKNLSDQINSLSTDRFIVRLKNIHRISHKSKIHVSLQYSESFAEYKRFVFGFGFYVGQVENLELVELFDTVLYRTDYQIGDLKTVRESYNAKLQELRETRQQFGWHEFLN